MKSSRGNNNIIYKTKQIRRFYSAHRNKWKQFYPSECWVFNRILKDKKTFGRILDVGCACGGLGMALAQRKSVVSYSGIDINAEAVRWAKENIKLSVPARFISGDIVKAALRRKFDTVVSLSCADWNIETRKIISACWEKVKPGGWLIISLRLTDEDGINDIGKSYQSINFFGRERKPEIANYVVFNFKDALKLFKNLTPCPMMIGAYGYWGKPSPQAVTLFNKLVFAVFYIKKPINHVPGSIIAEFNLPMELFEGGKIK
ncbi:MAG: class I SAM-dependent methyltransferase [Candidatus Omnitrophica bacterium]|nr:class I SAM-dependent methyltransferase [Candidatus Omnitrophota bacterium]